MRYRPTILNISVGIFLTGILIFTILNYRDLAFEEGWGIVAMIALAGYGLIAGLIDLVCQIFIKNTKLLNIVGISIVAVILGVFTLYDQTSRWARRSNIKFGNELIEKIENYRINEGKLPETGDLKTLEELGFRMTPTGTQPIYTKLDSLNYELFYFRKSDNGSYFLWNTKDSSWYFSFPKFLEVTEMEANFPWSKNITKIAVQAILTSIDNINNPDKPHDENFPTDIYNMPFTLKEKTEFVIFGYQHSENSPSIYRIEFHPKDSYDSGPRFTVEVDIDKEEALRVYMQPDA